MNDRNLLLFKLNIIFTEFNGVRQKINTLKESDKLILIKDMNKIKVVTDDGILLGYVPDIFFELISKSMSQDMANSIIDSIDKNIESPSISVIFDLDNNEIQEKKEIEIQKKEDVKPVIEIIQKPTKNNEALIKTIVFIVVFMLFFLSIAKCSDGGSSKIETPDISYDNGNLDNKGDEVNNSSYTESSCDVTSTEAEIKARDFAKTIVKSPTDLEFIDGSVDISGHNIFHVVESVKTMNGLGNMVPAKISIRMKYTGGDWTDDESWNVISIRLLNEATGQEE